MNSIVFYCTWGVVKKNGQYYLPDVHLSYLKEAAKIYNRVILLTTESVNPDTCTAVIPEEFEIYTLPKLGSYFQSIKQVSSYYKLIKTVLSKYPNSIYYLRVPQPFSWLFWFLKSRNSKLVYHLMSNPIEAILKREKDSRFIQLIKLGIYLPDFMLTMLAAKYNFCTCNGIALSQQLKVFLPKKTIILNESTLNEDDFVLEVDLKKRLNNSVLNLIYVGYLRSAKGIQYLLEAIRILKEQGSLIHLTIVGQGDMYEYCVKYIEDNNLQNHITLYGHVSDRGILLDLYSSNDVFVFPSLSEGSPRVVIEAMSRGLAVVATDVGNTKHLLNQNGFLVPPKSSNALADSINYYLEDEVLRLKHAKALLASSKKFTLSKYISSFKKVITDNEIT